MGKSLENKVSSTILENERLYEIFECDGQYVHHIFDNFGEVHEFNLGIISDSHKKNAGYSKKCHNCHSIFEYKSRSFFCSECRNCEIKKSKSKLSNLIKTGYVNSFQSTKVKEKIKTTNQEKYGVSNPMQSEMVRERVKSTNLEKYGVSNPMQSESIKKKGASTNLEKYGDTVYAKTNLHKEKMIINQLRKYGFDCYTRKEAKTLFSKEIEEMGFYEALEKRGMSYIVAMKHFVSSEIKSVGSIPEDNLFSKISEFFKGSKIEKNVRSVVPNNNQLEIDIHVPDEFLSIEYSGFYWHQIKEDKTHVDLSKAESMRSIGYTHYMINEIDEPIIDKIINSLNPNKTKLYAKQCVVKKVSNDESKSFLDKYHFQGHCNAKYTYGLYYEGGLVQLMSFSKSRFSKDVEYEMIRLCTSNGFKIVGGSQRLFKHFLKDINPVSIVSFSDNKFFSGKIYEKLGFSFIEYTKPNYVWYKNGVQLKRYQTMKHKLPELLGEESFDISSSETENMERNGWIKVKDLGNKKWTWKNH